MAKKRTAFVSGKDQLYLYVLGALVIGIVLGLIAGAALQPKAVLTATDAGQADLATPSPETSTGSANVAGLATLPSPSTTTGMSWYSVGEIGTPVRNPIANVLTGFLVPGRPMDFQMVDQYPSTRLNLSQCTSATKWTGTSWQTWKKGYPVNNFNVETGKGYLVQCPSTLNVKGPLVSDSLANPNGFTYRFNSGWNYMTPLCNATTYNGSAYTPLTMKTYLDFVKARGGKCDNMAKFLNNNWAIYQAGSSANNFNVVAGEGYLVMCNATVAFNATCGNTSNNNAFYLDLSSLFFYPTDATTGLQLARDSVPQITFKAVVGQQIQFTTRTYYESVPSFDLNQQVYNTFNPQYPSFANARTNLLYPPFPSMSVREQTFFYSYTSPGIYRVVHMVDTPNAVSETNEGNNVATFYINVTAATNTTTCTDTDGGNNINLQGTLSNQGHLYTDYCVGKYANGTLYVASNSSTLTEHMCTGGRYSDAYATWSNVVCSCSNGACV
ncbi:hypothetical protein HZB02_07250 [Candidatus Woesearchaeota archaeon]|nr:hypothetical protein [Candidatus Woesearchaeota archaeon]